MKLQKLCEPLEKLKPCYYGKIKDVEVSYITSHSQKVAPGALFIAKRGTVFDGNQYVVDALRSGAVAILSDMYNPTLTNSAQIIVSDVVRAEALVSAQFFGNPTEKLWMVGITGTSGKTTTSYLVRHLLKASQISTGLIGTVAYIAGKNEIMASRTTPDVIFNHKIAHDMLEAHDVACVMEVTSHALEQGRVYGIDFDVAVYTNLSHEHLDYHKSMDEYARAKKKLFEKMGSGRKKRVISIFNAQDPYFSYMKEGSICPYITYGIEDHHSDSIALDLFAKNISCRPDGTSFDLLYNKHTYPVFSPLPGRFNIYNVLAAIAVVLQKGIEIEVIIENLKTFSGPPGRLERIQNDLGVAIFVDYAHKEDALRKVLPTLRECTEGRIITVFGCGGDRDREKRPLMARAVEEFSDFAIVTSDNPRSESPDAIISEVIRGFQSDRYHIEPDRKKAIYEAIRIASPKDTILIAGKGHEKEQIFRNRTIHFDDCLVALEACEGKKV